MNHRGTIYHRPAHPQEQQGFTIQLMQLLLSPVQIDIVYAALQTSSDHYIDPANRHTTGCFNTTAQWITAASSNPRRRLVSLT